MKNIVSLLLVCILAFTTISCSKPKQTTVYTQENPYVTLDATKNMNEEMLRLNENNPELRNPNIATIDQFSSEVIEKKKSFPYGILIVEVFGSQTYYWDDGNGDKGGFTRTNVYVRKIIDKNNHSGFNYNVLENSQISFFEPYTIDPDGNFITPIYSQKYFSNKYSLYFSNPFANNPIMQYGKYYIILFVGTKIRVSGLDNSVKCYLSENDEKNDLGATFNQSDTPIWNIIRTSYLAPYSRIYEYSEEAYLRSKAIVEQYEREGKTKEDGTYYHYHAMVVDAWERYGMEKDSGA